MVLAQEEGHHGAGWFVDLVLAWADGHQAAEQGSGHRVRVQALLLPEIDCRGCTVGLHKEHAGLMPLQARALPPGHQRQFFLGVRSGGTGEEVKPQGESGSLPP